MCAGGKNIIYIHISKIYNIWEVHKFKLVDKLSLLVRPLLILFLHELKYGIDGRVRGPLVLGVSGRNLPDAVS